MNVPRKISLYRLLIILLFLGTMTACGKLWQGGHTGWQQVPRIIEQIVVPQFPNREYSITDFGAVGDSLTNCHAAIRQAIQRCNAEGGGRVIVPAGVYLCNGPIHLKSNVNLHLTAGARIVFSANPDDYLPVVLTKWEGVELFNYSPLIYAYQATNIAITGSGVLDGRATNGFATWKPKQQESQKLLRDLGNQGMPIHERVFGRGHYLRPSMIQPYSCKNVLIEGVTIIDSPFWVIHPTFCTNVTIRGVQVKSWNANNDGCDPDGCVNVLIEKCVFNTGDDAVAIKSGRDQDGWRVGQATENVIIRKCVMNSKTNGLCIGSEMSGSVRNVFWENCQMGETSSALYFKSNFDRGGVIESVWARDITVRRANYAVIRFESNYKNEQNNFHPPKFRKFVIEDIRCQQSDAYGIYAVGTPESKLEDVLLKNVIVEKAQKPLQIYQASDFRLVNVRINGELQPTRPPMSEPADLKLPTNW